MIKKEIHAHLGPIWYHSEPSDVPYSPNQFLGWDFFCRFLQQDGSSILELEILFQFFLERTLYIVILKRIFILVYHEMLSKSPEISLFNFRYFLAIRMHNVVKYFVK